MESKTVGFLGGKFLPLHMGHVYAIMDASNRVDELYVILSSSKKRDGELCARDGIKYIPAEIRLSWLGEFLNDLEHIKIIHVEDDQWDHNYDWAEGAKIIKEAIGKPIDYVFSSEETYSDLFAKHYPDSKHIIIDYKRETVPVSATVIRKNLYKYWDKLPNCVRSYFTKRVLIIGTESCGKSTLVKKLAKFFNTKYVHEVGRDYCDRFSNHLTREMFEPIAMEHFLLQEQKARESNKILFIDTDATITQYYLDMYFNGETSGLIEEITHLQKYDLVIFLEPDIPWVEDGLRFAGEDSVRTSNNQKLKQMFFVRGINFVVMRGSFEERFNKAKFLAGRLLNSENQNVSKNTLSILR